MRSPDRIPQQDPQKPQDDPGQKNPKLPVLDEPNDKPHPQPDPGQQPID